jgi:two-component system, OmpR family, sensor histidine kinase SenX3
MPMRLTGRKKTMTFFVILGVCLVTAAVALTGRWIILNWRERVFLFFGVVFFLAIITGLILNTGFLVREIRRNEQHDSFINAVTHELKTPITSVRLYLETLQRREVDEAQRQKFYHLMLDDMDRLRGTVDQVLKAGEVGYKHAPLHPTTIDLGDLVTECMDLARVRHHLDIPALRWQQSPNGHPITIQGDPDELRTAIGNILDNAIKYSGEHVDVSVRIDTPDEKHVALRIQDKGMGIRSDELKRIFKRFYRVPSRGASPVKGTGLGLFIVRGIARAHGGRVFAESGGETRGTTVTLELPRNVS